MLRLFKLLKLIKCGKGSFNEEINFEKLHRCLYSYFPHSMLPGETKKYSRLPISLLQGKDTCREDKLIHVLKKIKSSDAMTAFLHVRIKRC